MKAKRFLSVLLAAMLMISCFAISASAEDSVILGDDETYTLNINLWVEGSTESSSVAIKNATFIVKDSTGEQVGEEISTGTTGVAVFTTKTRGTYTVEQKDLGGNQAEKVSSFTVNLPMTNPAGTGFLKTVDVYPKVPVFTDKPVITKKVADDAAGPYGMSASIMSYEDKLAYWKITVLLPANIANYKAFRITDVLDERLIDPSEVTVTNNGTDAQAFEEGDYKGNKFGENGKMVLEFAESGIKKLVANSTIDLTFTTKIDIANENAIAQKIGNHTVLNYTDAAGDPGVTDNTPDVDTDNTDPDPDPETDEPAWPTNPGDEDGKDDPYVWTGILTFTKIKTGDDKTTLSDAEFQIFNADDDKAVGAVMKGSEDGVFTAVGLKKGSYYLVETKAPEGYQLIGAKIPFVITGVEDAVVTFTKTAAETIAEAEEINFSFGEPSVNYIVNIPAEALPLTGGIGTGIFAILGITFALLGGAYLLKSRKIGSR